METNSKESLQERYNEWCFHKRRKTVLITGLVCLMILIPFEIITAITGNKINIFLICNIIFQFIFFWLLKKEERILNEQKFYCFKVMESKIKDKIRR